MKLEREGAKAMTADTSDAYNEYASLLDAVRGIRWPARSLVRGGIPGAHTSRVWGSSAEFTEYRPYRQGDDLRRIDWKLFARSDRAYIRLSNDRSVLPTMIVLDASASMGFPLATNGKWRLAAQLGVALAAVARNGSDPVGLLIGGSGKPELLAPRMRQSALHEIIRTVAATRPGGGEPMAPPLFLAAQSVGRVIIVSDFLGDASEILSVVGRLVAAGREAHAVHVMAPEEIDPPRDAAMVNDPEAPAVRRALIGETRDAYVASYRAWRESIAQDFTDAGIAYTPAVVGEEPPEHLVRRLTAPRGIGTSATA